jgi:hypothetical protein
MLAFMAYPPFRYLSARILQDSGSNLHPMTRLLPASYFPLACGYAATILAPAEPIVQLRHHQQVDPAKTNQNPHYFGAK